MLNPKEQHDAEQGSAYLAEFLPPAWWGIYSGCLKEGFSEAQSFELVRSWMMAMCMRGQ